MSKCATPISAIKEARNALAAECTNSILNLEGLLGLTEFGRKKIRSRVEHLSEQVQALDSWLKEVEQCKDC